MATRTARINGMRGLLREFGVVAPAGAKRFLADLPAQLEAQEAALPPRLRSTLLSLWKEVRELEERIEAVQSELQAVARHIPVLLALLEIPGVGVLTATALWAAIGNVHSFRSGRHLASWLGLTPRESSSGQRRRLGRISKQGDPYLRTLLIHGARSALRAAQQRNRAGKPLTRLQEWAVQKAQVQHYNSAAVALANKTARVIWAVWHHERSFDGDYLPQAA